MSGRTTPDQLPALVAAEYRGAKWIIFGNRRLKVLQELEPRWPSLKARVIVHDMPNSGLEPPELARAFEMKFILAWTSQTARQG